MGNSLREDGVTMHWQQIQREGDTQGELVLVCSQTGLEFLSSNNPLTSGYRVRGATLTGSGPGYMTENLFVNVCESIYISVWVYMWIYLWEHG